MSQYVNGQFAISSWRRSVREYDGSAGRQAPSDARKIFGYPMNTATSAPSSLERDMPPADAHHHGSVGPAETAIGVIIGSTSEFFDFFVYAIASVLVFQKLVFPFAYPLDWKGVGLGKGVAVR